MGRNPTTAKKALKLERVFEPTRLASQAMQVTYAVIVPVRAKWIPFGKRGEQDGGQSDTDFAVGSNVTGELA
jgi:hypothetical protein